MSSPRSALWLMAMLAATPSLLRGQVSFSNNATPGDSFTNPGGSNQGQAVGGTGWYYNNVRNSGAVGIRTDLPRSGNGSAWFNTPSDTAKADIEFLANAVNPSGNFFATSTLGLFSKLSAMAYDWYRDSASTVGGHLHPVMRVLLDKDGDLLTAGDRGGLVFELAYNPPATVPTDAWVTQPIISSSKLWGFGAFPDGGYTTTLAAWQADPANSATEILGFSLGVGSGWTGDFKGAVDNPTWFIDGVTTTTNFEVIPEPATITAFVGLTLLGFGVWRRYRGASS